MEKLRSFCRKTHVHKIPRFKGGGVFWVLGGGECRFYFYGRGDFSEKQDAHGTKFWEHASIDYQKRGDVHKIALYITLRFPPPPGKSVDFEDFLLICTVFPHFRLFSGGGGGAKFCGQEFYGQPDFFDH